MAEIFTVHYFYYTEEVMRKPLEIIMQKVIFFAMKQKCVDDVTDHCLRA